MLTPALKEILIDNQIEILNGIKTQVLDSIEDNVEFIGHYTAADEKSFRNNVLLSLQDYLNDTFSTVQKYEVADITEQDLESLFDQYFFNKENYYENYQN